MNTVAEVVASDLCIGCGLCTAVTDGRVAMVMTATGSLRPDPVDGFDSTEEAAIIAACPGVTAEARPDPDPDPDSDPDPHTDSGTEGGPDSTVDPVWGRHRSMFHGWAADPGVRHRAATGGVLTALGCFLLESGAVGAVLHVGADPDRPTRSRWVLSTSVESVRSNTGSRYGPTAPLAGLVAALDRGEPFAVIAKPCDLGAIHRYGRVDRRVDELCVARLALVCGGQSRLTKTTAVLDELGLAEREVALFRYRGHGNPGPARVETEDGRFFERSYLDLWGDESGWDLETRCKLCPDALGEAADVVSADAWPGGAPDGEDEGFNAVVVRTTAGRRLVDDAVAAGHLVIGEPIDPRQLDDMQPHQVRKKEALAARFEGLTDAGVTPIATIGLRIDQLGSRLGEAQRQAEREGTARRIRERRSDPAVSREGR